MIDQLESVFIASGKLLVGAKLRVLKALTHSQLGGQKHAKSAMTQRLALLGEQPSEGLYWMRVKPPKIWSASFFEKPQKLAN